MTTERDAADRAVELRHLRVGWSSLFVYATLGTVLELLHAYKAPWYLGVATESRRFLWTLAHAHGVALGLVNVLVAAVCRRLPRALSPLGSRALVAGTLLVPAGFLVGGAWARGGDPGLGAVLVPPGALLVLLALGLVARASFGRDGDG